jgi:4-hydroxybenzoate polyprenyltransferase
MKLLRVHQWSKNILIFVPLVLSHQVNSVTNLTLALKAFISFCLMASSVYILNDILDVQSDRKHPKKRFRPIPSGDVQLPLAVFAFTILLSSSVFFSLQLTNWSMVLYPLFYLGLNLLYSAYLKQLLIVDICVLTSFYLIRLIYGGAATGFDVSYWMLSFSFFIFFSLAVIKRYIEIYMLFHLQGRKSSSGRAYQFEDMPILLGIGISTGIASVIVLSMYFQFGVKLELYSNPKYLWGIEALILVWICNIWVRTVRGKVDDDPVKFALTDKFSLIIAILIVIMGMLAV